MRIFKKISLYILFFVVFLSTLLSSLSITHLYIYTETTNLTCKNNNINADNLVQNEETQEKEVADFEIKYPDYIFQIENNKSVVANLKWTTFAGSTSDVQKTLRDIKISFDVANDTQVFEKTLTSDIGYEIKSNYEEYTSTILIDTLVLSKENFNQDWKIKLSFLLCYSDKEIPISHGFTYVPEIKISGSEVLSNNDSEGGGFASGTIQNTDNYINNLKTIVLDNNKDYKNSEITINDIWDSSMTSECQGKYVIADFYSNEELNSEYTVIKNDNKIGFTFKFLANPQQDIQKRIVSLQYKVSPDGISWATATASDAFYLTFVKSNNYEEDYVDFYNGLITVDFNSQVRNFVYVNIHSEYYESIEKDCYVDLKEVYFSDNQVVKKETNFSYNISIESTPDIKPGWTKLRIDLGVPEVPIQPLYVDKINKSAEYQITVYTPNSWTYGYNLQTQSYEKEKPISIVNPDNSCVWIKFRDQVGENSDKLIAPKGGSHFNDINQPSAIYETHLNGKENKYWNSNKYQIDTPLGFGKIKVLDELQEDIKNQFETNNIAPTIRDDEKYWDLVTSYCSESFSPNKIDPSSAIFTFFDFALTTGYEVLSLVSNIGTIRTALNIVYPLVESAVENGMNLFQTYLSDKVTSIWRPLDSSTRKVKVLKELKMDVVSKQVKKFAEWMGGKHVKTEDDNILFTKTKNMVQDKSGSEDFIRSSTGIIREKLKNNKISTISSQIYSMVDTGGKFGLLDKFLLKGFPFTKIARNITRAFTYINSLFSTQSYDVKTTSIGENNTPIIDLVPNYEKRNLYYTVDKNTVDENVALGSLKVNQRVVDTFSTDPYFTSTHFNNDICTTEKVKLSNDKEDSNNFGISMDQSKEYKPGLNEKVGKLWINNDTRIDSRTKIKGKILDQDNNPITEPGWGINIRTPEGTENDFRWIDISIPKETSYPVFKIKCEIEKNTDLHLLGNIESISDNFLVENIASLKTKWNVSEGESFVIDQKNSEIQKKFTFETEFSLLGEYKAQVFEKTPKGDSKISKDFTASLEKNDKKFTVKLNRTKDLTIGKKEYFLTIDKINKAARDIVPKEESTLMAMSKTFKANIKENIYASNISSFDPENPGKIREVKKGSWTPIATIVQLKPTNEKVKIELNVCTKGMYNLLDPQIKCVQKNETTLIFYLYIPNQKLGTYDNGSKFAMNLGINYFVDNTWFNINSPTTFYVVP